jgi:hypothetical protein
VTAKRAAREPIGPVQKRHRAELRKLGFTATSVDALSSLGVLVIDLAKTVDRTRAARDKAALSRELRILMDQARAAAAPPKGDVVDEVAEQRARRRSGAAAAGAAGVDEQG